MSKFKVVKKTPTELNEGEYLIDTPSFMEQIAKHRAKAPRNGLTGSHHLRMLTDSIAQAYDPEQMSAYSIKAQKYEGLPVANDEALDAVLVNALKQDYPAVFPKYLETKIRARPKDTKLVIYVDSGIKNQYEIFFKNGLSDVADEKEEKQKSDKVVGKPALTKEQAEKLKHHNN